MRNPNPPRTIVRVFKWLAVLLGVFVVLVVAGVLVLHQWLGSNDFRGRAEQEASRILGVPVTIKALTVAAFPVPAVEVQGIDIAAKTPLSVGEVRVRPDWRAALRGEVAISALIVRDAVLPEEGVDAVLAGLRKLAQTPARGGAPGSGSDGSGGTARWLPRRTVLDGVTWVSATGKRTTVDAVAHMAPDGLPRDATLKIVQGAYQGVEVALEPGQGNARWQFNATIGGGTVQGPVSLVMPGVAAAPASAAQSGTAAVAAQADAQLDIRLDGTLQTRGVQVADVTAPARPMTGKLDADTTFTARANGFASLAESLRSNTKFTVRDGELTGLDLLKAVETVGLTRGGTTKLDVLTGNLATQGRSGHVTQLEARAGSLALHGDVTISPARALSGRVNVDVVRGTGGLVSVPLQVGGTLSAPEVTLSRGALLGAAIGTAVLPGVGTGAGAKLGDKIGSKLKGLFGK